MKYINEGYLQNDRLLQFDRIYNYRFRFRGLFEQLRGGREPRGFDEVIERVANILPQIHAPVPQIHHFLQIFRRYVPSKKAKKSSFINFRKLLA